MLFNTVTYAYFFTTVFVVTWLLAPWRRLRLGVLLVSSYIFYAGWTFVGWEQLLGLDPGTLTITSGEPLLGQILRILQTALRRLPVAATTGAFWREALQSCKYVPLLFVATSIDYYLGIALDAVKDPQRRKLMLLATVALNVGILIFFKYWNWGADSLVWLLETAFNLEIGDIRLRVDLPIGISFFCFMSLSYVIDVYRKQIPACRSYLNYLTYISFFPHLVAGPIIRGRDLLPHLERKTRLTSETSGEGLFLIAAGLFKKVIIGDYIAVNFVDRVFAEPTSYSAVEAMTAMCGYAVQVYCDFAGYSDVAIGSALLLGYRFKINFDAPFKSTNIVEFWRRWHISLSTWLRDYVYISLGGSRRGKFRQYLNIFLTMLICGIWHGAAWTYFVFGCIQGIALSVTHWFKEVREEAGWQKKAAIAAGITLATWLVVNGIARHYQRPGVGLLLGALLAGGWIVAIVLALAALIDRRALAQAEKKTAFSQRVALARKMFSALMVAGFAVVIAVLLHGIVRDVFDYELRLMAMVVIAAVVGLGIGWKVVQLRFSSAFGVAANFTFVALTFTMFRAASLDKAWSMYERLLSLTTYTPNLHRSVLLIMLGALVLQWSPRRLYDGARRFFIAAPAPVQALLMFAIAIILRIASSAEAVPFVYFQF